MIKDNAKISRGCPSLDTENQDSPICRKGNACKLNVNDWLRDLPLPSNDFDLVEIRFKSTRKAYYKNVNKLGLEIGDLVAVEASPGHDIGVVSLTGELVLFQLRKNNIPFDNEFPKVYRKTKPGDIEKWEEAIELDHPTMIAARQISTDLKLDMKIGDVEYQGDKTKAIFYYIAEERVDFRELIKVFADRFRVRIEMRQIGARQEAGRIGGIGPCGRELCCSSFITNFVSVSTNAARIQDLSLNPQKLAGQCGKLKCCLNYEVESYIDAQSGFPKTSIILNTERGPAYHFKSDIFRGIMWYSYDRNYPLDLTPISIEKVTDIIEKNKKGIVVPTLVVEEKEKSTEKHKGYQNVIIEDNIDRFDTDVKPKKKKNKRRNKKKNNNNNESQNKS